MISMYHNPSTPDPLHPPTISYLEVLEALQVLKVIKSNVLIEKLW